MAEPAELNPARRAARVGLVVCGATAVGLAAHCWRGETPLLDWVYFDLGGSERVATLVDRALVALLALAALQCFTGRRRGCHLLAGCAAAMAAVSTLRGTFHPELEPLAHAARWLGPLGVAALLSASSAERPAAAIGRGEWLLRIAAAATFAGHGLEALFHKAVFVDYLHSALRTFLGVADASDDALRNVLTAIGILDLGVAAAMLLPLRLVPLAAWMAFWGFLTALARVVHYGVAGGWTETALRTVNGGIPLVLLVLWWGTRRAASNPVDANPDPTA